MVGTSLDDVRGGIGTVVRGYRDSGFFERFPIRYLTTHREGSALTKASVAFSAYGRLMSELLKGDSPLVHVHLASRASFWRKSVVCALASPGRVGLMSCTFTVGISASFTRRSVDELQRRWCGGLCGGPLWSSRCRSSGEECCFELHQERGCGCCRTP